MTEHQATEAHQHEGSGNPAAYAEVPAPATDTRQSSQPPGTLDAVTGKPCFFQGSYVAIPDVNSAWANASSKPPKANVAAAAAPQSTPTSTHSTSVQILASVPPAVNLWPPQAVNLQDTQRRPFSASTVAQKFTQTVLDADAHCYPVTIPPSSVPQQISGSSMPAVNTAISLTHAALATHASADIAYAPAGAMALEAAALKQPQQQSAVHLTSVLPNTSMSAVPPATNRLEKRLIVDVKDAGTSSGQDIGGSYTPDNEAEGGNSAAMDFFKARESRRLQQNREAARRFRQKKKSLLNELQNENATLREENALLLAAHATAAAPTPPRQGQGQQPAVVQVRTWWGHLQALIHRNARTDSGSSEEAAAVVVKDLKALFDVYPEVLRAMLTEGNVVLLCNQLHCPPHLRAALWHGSLQPSVLLALAISQAAPEPRELEGPPSDPPPPTTLQAQLFELRAHFDEQEAYFEQYTHSAAAELRRMLADTTQHAGIPQHLPFLAILPIAAAQLVKSLVQSLQQLLSASQLRDVLLVWISAVFSFEKISHVHADNAVQLAVTYISGSGMHAGTVPVATATDASSDAIPAAAATTADAHTGTLPAAAVHTQNAVAVAHPSIHGAAMQRQPSTAVAPAAEQDRGLVAQHNQLHASVDTVLAMPHSSQ